jgi:hypothetical protein
MRMPSEPVKLMPTIVRSFSVPATQILHSIFAPGELVGTVSLYPSQLMARPGMNVNAIGAAPRNGRGAKNSVRLSRLTFRSVAAFPKVPKANANREVRKGFKQSNVELIRANDGAARAPHEACLRRASDLSKGYAYILTRSPLCGMSRKVSRSRNT